MSAQLAARRASGQVRTLAGVCLSLNAMHNRRLLSIAQGRHVLESIATLN